tara:strand:+ start:684 stop:2528 length:1845 start_codon:yes stop_codon:yes gene_type:complete
MSKKVTGNDLKNLVKEVLGKQRLDEKKYYTSKGAPAFDDDVKTYDSAKALKKSSVFDKAKEKPNGTEFEKMAGVSKDTGINGEEPLTFADLKTAASHGSRKHSRQRFEKHINPDIKKAVLGTVDDDTEEISTRLQGELGTVYKLTDKSTAKDFKKAAKKAFKSISDNSTLQTATPAVTAISAALRAVFPDSKELKDIIKIFSDLKGKYAPLTMRDRGALGRSNTGIKAGDRSYTQMYSDPEFDVANVGQTTGDARGDETTAQLRDQMKVGFTSVVDSSALAVADLFGGTAGTETELLSLTKNIRTVVEQIASIGTGNDKTQGFTGADAFKFAAQANFIFQLFNAGKMAEGKQAGYDFERFCGLLFGGVVSGKANGAVDVVTASKNGFLRMSQKFVNNKNQIKQNYDNTKKVVVTQNTPIYYMSLIKGGDAGAASYDSLDMYVIKLEKSGNNMKSSYLDSSGNFKTAQSKVAKSSDKSPQALIYEGANPITFDLGLSALGTDPTAAAKAVADKIAGSTSDDVKAIHEASTQIYQLSKNMMRNTEEYRAVKGGSKGGTSTGPLDYLNQLSTDYVTLKTNYKDMFAVTNDKPTKGGLREQKITASFLKKLIQENFKK